MSVGERRLAVRLRGAALRLGWRLPLLRFLGPTQPVVLLWHGVPEHGLFDDRITARDFALQVQFLKRHFQPVSIHEWKHRRRRWERIRVIVTFDDGFLNNATDAAPILEHFQVPATFFVCHRHADPDRPLWFSYLEAIEARYFGTLHFSGETYDLAGTNRATEVARLREMLLELRPHPAAMYRAIDEELPPLGSFLTRDEMRQNTAGLTETALRELAEIPWFTIGVHTVDHPYLTRCEPDEQARQIRESINWIEGATGEPPRYFAYPLGDYDANVVECSRRLGLSAGFAVTDRGVRVPDFEVVRIGVARPSLDILGFKVQWGMLLRRIGVRFG